MLIFHLLNPTYLARDHPHKNIMTIATRLETLNASFVSMINRNGITIGNVEINIRKKIPIAFLTSGTVSRTSICAAGKLGQFVSYLVEPSVPIAEASTGGKASEIYSFALSVREKLFEIESSIVLFLFFCARTPIRYIVASTSAPGKIATNGADQ